MTSKGRLFPALILIPILLIGCSKGNPNTASSVTGKVTYKDKPIGAGTVTFHTQAGIFTAPIKPDGTYSISQMPVGDADVTVETESANKSRTQSSYEAQMGKKGGLPGKGGAADKAPGGVTSPMPEGFTPPPSGEYLKIPAKYASVKTSGLKATLTSGKQTLDWLLKD